MVLNKELYRKAYEKYIEDWLSQFAEALKKTGNIDGISTIARKSQSIDLKF
jgi:hypothetical protein